MVERVGDDRIGFAQQRVQSYADLATSGEVMKTVIRDAERDLFR